MTGSATRPYIGRFAPTPSGPLHLGSLVTAVASYCDARAHRGQWLLRVEDVDTPRNVKGATDDILRTLENHSLYWDGDIYYQSQQFEHYESLLDQLKQQGILYSCECSKKMLLNQNPDYGPLGLIYPGNCRDRKVDIEHPRWRLRMQDNVSTIFNDLHCGPIELNLSEQVGDVILKRNDGVFAYHLAVVFDDAVQNINTIVRGADLLQVTNLHIYLNRVLNFTSADYLHIPLVRDAEGNKLSKQTGATAIELGQTIHNLIRALTFLGQRVGKAEDYQHPEELLQHAVTVWDRRAIPAVQGLT